MHLLSSWNVLVDYSRIFVSALRQLWSWLLLAGDWGICMHSVFYWVLPIVDRPNSLHTLRRRTNLHVWLFCLCFLQCGYYRSDNRFFELHYLPFGNYFDRRCFNLHSMRCGDLLKCDNNYRHLHLVRCRDVHQHYW